MALRQPVKLRRADIPVDVRRAFEETGSFSMSAELSANYPPAKRILRDKYPDREIKDFGYAWIGEHYDRDERHQDRLETLEWAILIFVVLGVIVESADKLAKHPKGYPGLRRAEESVRPPAGRPQVPERAEPAHGVLGESGLAGQQCYVHYAIGRDEVIAPAFELLKGAERG
jgi:hypothetical protein